jgi:hypothetical protein
MPTDRAQGQRDAVAFSGEGPTSDLHPTDAHIAQTIDPAADGCRTIVLTVDAEAPRGVAAGRDPSILDGGLETTWVVPSRGRRFDRDEQVGTDVVLSLHPEPEPEALELDLEPPVTDEPAPRPRASFHATGDDAAVARLEEDRRTAERRRRRRAEAAATTTTQRPARRRSGPAPAAAAALPVERHTVRISGTPDPLLSARPSGAVTAGFAPRRGLALPAMPIGGLLDRPDRIALWAVLLGVFLILVAATSG